MELNRFAVERFKLGKSYPRKADNVGHNHRRHRSLVPPASICCACRGCIASRRRLAPGAHRVVLCQKYPWAWINSCMLIEVRFTVKKEDLMAPPREPWARIGALIRPVKAWMVRLSGGFATWCWNRATSLGSQAHSPRFARGGSRDLASLGPVSCSGQISLRNSWLHRNSVTIGTSSPRAARSVSRSATIGNKFRPPDIADFHD